MNDNPSTAAVPAEAPAPGCPPAGPRRAGKSGPRRRAAGAARGRREGRQASPSGLPITPRRRSPLRRRLAWRPLTNPPAAEGNIAQGPGAPLTPRQAMRQLNQTTMALALRHHLAGRLRQAEPLYRAVLRRAPAHSAALINLSALLRVSGRLPESREMAERAVAADPARSDDVLQPGCGAAPAAPGPGGHRGL